jgi:pilus assembly protein CpaE
MKAVLIGVEEDLLPHVRRELANCWVDIDVEFAKSAPAMDALRKVRGERRLLVYRLASSRDLDSLSQLTVLLPGWPVLALVGSGDAPTDLVAGDVIGFMRAGVSQVVSVPPRAIDFKEALERISVQFVHAHAGSSVIAIGGATGGCGATTIAINVAHEIVHGHGYRCILVDLSLRIGMVASHLDVTAPFSIVDLLRDVSRVDTVLAERALIKVAGGLKILAGPSEIGAPVSVSARDVAYLVATLSQMADVIVIDVPATYDDLYFETLASANQTVLVGEQTLPSVRALKLVHETLAETKKSGDIDQIVINRFDPKNTAFAPDRLLKPIGTSSLLTIACDNAATSAALEKGCPIRLVNPRSQVMADIVALTQMLVSPPATPIASAPGILSRMRRVFSN